MVAASEGVETVLNELGEALRADGGDLHLVAIDGQTAHIRLSLGSETCAECIAGEEILYSILHAAIISRVPGISAITLDDPRRSGDPATGGQA